MMHLDIVPPMPLRVVHEDELRGEYEIDGLSPGYGYTLGPGLRRILLSSLPGAAITSVKIEGANHEFMTLPGVKEDVLSILLNLKLVRLRIHAPEPQQISIHIKGQKTITAADFTTPTQVEIVNEDAHIATLTTKDALFNLEATVERGLGYIPREVLKKEKVGVGVMTLDATMTPIRRVNYEVENMRIGDRTDYNRLRFFIETDGTVTPKDAFARAVEIFIAQLEPLLDRTALSPAKDAVVETTEIPENPLSDGFYSEDLAAEKKEEGEEDPLKIRVEDLKLSSRTLNILSQAGIRTVGGLVKKKEEDLLSVQGFGKKSVEEIEGALESFGLSLKS